VQALNSNTASGNSALGYQALFRNTTGSTDTAVGYQALLSNTIGSVNTAVGDHALQLNSTGVHNTACGAGALRNNSTGSFNIALGDFAGANLTNGIGNIEIGHAGFAGEHDTIRIGNASHQKTFIGGIYSVDQGMPDLPVYVSSGNQLGTHGSSRRFKKDIYPMDKASESILALKPVAFHYKNDATNTPQFGLIAEEVAQVNPALVVRDKNNEIYSVRYDQVNAMLLNEFLKEHRHAQEQDAIIARQQEQIDALTAGLQKVSAQLEASRPPPQVVNNP